MANGFTIKPGAPLTASFIQTGPLELNSSLMCCAVSGDGFVGEKTPEAPRLDGAPQSITARKDNVLTPDKKASLLWTLMNENNLVSPDPKERRRAVAKVARLMPQLDFNDPLVELVDAGIEGCITKGHDWSIKEVHRLFPLLADIIVRQEPMDRFNSAIKLVRHIEYSVVVNALKKVIDTLGSDARVAFMVAFIQDQFEGTYVDTAQFMPFKVNGPMAAHDGPPPWTNKTLKSILSSYAPLERHQIVTSMADYLREVEKKNVYRKPLIDALALVCSRLSPSQRVELISEEISSQGLSKASLIMLDALSHDIPTGSLIDQAQKQGNADLMTVARYRDAGVPFNYLFWREYIDATDPDTYLKGLVLDIAAHRKGKVLTIADERELRLAYTGLDAPAELSFAQFVERIDKKIPPKPFLTVPFTARVRLLPLAYTSMDQELILTSLQPVEMVKGQRVFREFLASLMKERDESLEPVWKDLVRAFPRLAEGMKMGDLIAAARKLLPKIWNRKEPAIRKLAYHLAYFLGWHARGYGSVRRRMRETVSLRDVVTVALLKDGLKATEEFHQVVLEEVVRQVVGIAADTNHHIRTLRKRLKQEVKQLQGAIGNEVEVAFVPSKCQADAFFGHIGRNYWMNEEEAIHDKKFQVYRMIAGERLVGMIYVGKDVFGDGEERGKRVLGVVVQPRRSWKVDHQDLLAKVETNISRIAQEEGYDYALLTLPTEHWDDRDGLAMLNAVQDRGYPEANFDDYMTGSVFIEPAEFFIMWKRE